MRLTDPREFVQLGGQIRYLAARKAGAPVFGKALVLDNLKIFRERLKKLGLIVSCNLFDSLLAELVGELEELERSAEEGEAGKLTEAHAEVLTDSVLQLEKTVFAEAKTQVIAIPVPRRIELEHLLSDPGKVVGQGVFASLTDLAQSDIVAACRCIAFECPTAAAFHVLRAVEECVRILYRAYLPRGNDKRPWGALTGELKAKPRKPNPDQILMTHIDHLRQRFRNPTDHPEKIYEIEEAEDLIHIAVDIINRCVRDPKVIERRQK